MGKLWRQAVRVFRSFWIIPVVCVVSAVVIAETLVTIDRTITHSDWPILAPLYRLGIEGSRGLLAAIGGTTFGAAATAFSITISVIATASTSYGPRLVGNFMSDRRNQWTLGVLVSTFVYTTLVVRTMRSATDDGDAFVPHLAVHFAILLAIVDVFLLISFIHHIARSIQVDTLTNVVSQAFQRAATRHDDLMDEADTSDASPPDGGSVLLAEESGYIVHIDPRALLAAATDDNGRVAMEVRVGDRVLPGSPVARLWPGQSGESLADKVRGAVDVGDQHDPATDARFAQQQILELAVRALSPGVNDPYTAVNVIEELAPVLAVLVASPETRPALRDEAGTERVFLRPVTLREMVDMPFDQILPFAAGQHLVHLALVDLARHVEQHNVHEHVRGAAWANVERVREQSAEGRPEEVQRLDEHIARAQELLALTGSAV